MARLAAALVAPDLEETALITLMVNVYAEDPAPAIASAREWLPIDREVVLHGRYEGFPERPATTVVDRAGVTWPGGGPVWPSEHAKRNRMLELTGEPDPDRWLFWLDCDERVAYASPLIDEQLRRFEGDVAGIRFVEPLSPDPSLLPGLQDPRRRCRDIVRDNFPLRLYRHLPGLEYRNRHDALWFRNGHLSGVHAGNGNVTIVPADQVDLTIIHLWWDQSVERRAAKQAYYSGPIRSVESAPISSRPTEGGWE